MKLSTIDIIRVLSFLVTILILVKIYHYLVQLEFCECFNQNKDYKTDIEYMKFYQVLEIISASILFGFLFISKKSKFMKKSLGGINWWTLFAFVINLYIFGYMSFNTFRFYINMNNDCKCANKWQKYFIYLQGVTSSITALRLAVGFLFVISILLFSFFK